MYRLGRLPDLVAAARETSIPTHGGALAIAAAAATAAAVSAAVEGVSPPGIIEAAERAAAMTGRDRPEAAVRFSATVRDVYEDLKLLRELRPAELAAKFFPNSPLTIVPLALGLATNADSAKVAILLATNIGGDSDSVASIAGGILGARYPASLPDEWHSVVSTINGHDLEAVAESLSALRR